MAELAKIIYLKYNEKNIFWVKFGVRVIIKLENIFDIGGSEEDLYLWLILIPNLIPPKHGYL